MIKLTAVRTRPAGAYDRIDYSLAFSGSYQPGGDTIDFTSVINTQALADVPQPSLLPDFGIVIEQALDGYYTELIQGTALNNWKLRVWQPGGTEYTAGAYGAPFTNATPGKVWIEIQPQRFDR
jgi:hypothetical protein